MSSGLEKSFVRLTRAVIDSYMEGFETAFPGVVKKVNDDGTVDQDDFDLIMLAYNNLSRGEPSGLTAEQENLADCNRDGRITAVDASYCGGFITACTQGTYTNNSAGWIQYMTDRFTS